MSVTDHVPEADPAYERAVSQSAEISAADGTPATNQLSILAALAICLLTFACHLPLLGGAPLGGTEAHRALPAHDMVRSGQWAFPKLFGRVYLAKPPLHDWFIAMSEIVLRSANEFAWRLPSVLAAVLLNLALYFFGTRWFGRIGGMVSGLAGLALIVLWGQARTADVDSTNTCFGGLAALCLVESYFANPSRRWTWIVGSGVAIGMTLLIKLHAGLPLVAGVLLWALLETGRRYGRQQLGLFLRSGVVWGPLLIGLAIFVTYVVAAYFSLRAQHLRPDYGGLAEGLEKSHPAGWKSLALALALPVYLFAFALPVSLALPLMAMNDVRAAIAKSGARGGSDRLRLATSLAGATLTAWAVCVLSGMTNPRYGYVALTLLCPLAGAIAGAVPFLQSASQSLLRGVLVGCAVVLTGGVGVLAFLAWRGGEGRPQMLAAFGGSVVVTAITFWLFRSRRSWIGSWGIVALVALAAVPFAYHFRVDRFDRSGYSTAPFLRQTVGTRVPVLTGGMLRSQPELFYYAGVNTVLGDIVQLPSPDHFAGDCWVCLNEAEYARWIKAVPDRLSHITRIQSHKLVGYIAWYSPAPAGTTTSRSR